MEIIIQPIGFVKNIRNAPTDDHWESIVSEIELTDNIPSAALLNIAEFSHLEIIYLFNQVNPVDIVFSGRPRGNPNYPEVGIFGQRKKDRPNRIGLCTVELLSCSERSILVKYLDAINGSPVLDIKPVFREFQPTKTITQPAWVQDLMKEYW